MSEPFDPFDESNRDRGKRRKPHEVQADLRAWNERIDNHFRRELDAIGWPDYIDSEATLSAVPYNPDTNLPMEVLKRNFKVSMERLGYEKFTLGNNVRGRYKIDDAWTTVYKKKEAEKIGRDGLREALGKGQ